MWKCSTAFVLGAATHYLVSTYLSNENRNDKLDSIHSVQSSDDTAVSAPSTTNASEDTPSEDIAAIVGSESSEDNDWEGKDSSIWKPQKMVLCVRTDLGMGKGIVLSLSYHFGVSLSSDLCGN